MTLHVILKPRAKFVAELVLTFCVQVVAGLERCKPVGHLPLMLHVMLFNKNTLMNGIMVGFLLLMHVNVIYIMGLF